MTATPPRAILIVVAACLTAMTAGIMIGHYGIPAPVEKTTSSSGFDAYRAEADSSEAMANVRATTPALEAWNADHGGYEGATLEQLRSQYDYGLHDVRFAFATRDDYCFESRVGGGVASKHGPAGEVLPGPCA